MSNRIERANAEIQRCLLEIIQTKMNDPRLDKIVSITEVNVTPDFKYCKAKVSVLDINDMSNVTNIRSMFSGCEIVKNLPDISEWNTNSLKNLSGLFHQ